METHTLHFTVFIVYSVLQDFYKDTCRKQSWHKKHQINNRKEVLIFHSPVLMTIQATEGEITPWSTLTVCANF